MIPIAITGMGATCAIGDDVSRITTALLTGTQGIRPSTRAEAPYAGHHFGEVGASNAEMSDRLSGSIPILPRSRTALLAMIATLEALGGDRDQQDTLVISASTVGGMDLTENHFQSWRNGSNAGIADLIEHPVGHHTIKLAELIGSRAMRTTISTACSSSANSIAFGAQLLRAGLAKRVLAGGTDALCRFTVEGFQALSAMDPLPSRPFSDDRNGMNLGEGAAYLVMERLEDAKTAGREPLAILNGWANRNDAFHQTATSNEGHGPYNAMRDAITMAGLQLSDIDHINAHGTGTVNNDETELTAMERLFDTVPAFTSTKALTGHTLGAAGAVEAVISIICIREGLLPAAHLNATIMPGNRSMPIERSTRRSLRHVLSNSLGFGGNDSSLLISAA